MRDNPTLAIFAFVILTITYVSVKLYDFMVRTR